MVRDALLHSSIGQNIQESWAIAKMTARCAVYMGALKISGSPCLCPQRLFPKF